MFFSAAVYCRYQKHLILFFHPFTPGSNHPLIYMLQEQRPALKPSVPVRAGLREVLLSSS